MMGVYFPTDRMKLWDEVQILARREGKAWGDYMADLFERELKRLGVPLEK